MAQYTPNYNMIKPTIDDDALIADINGNMDIIDTEMRATRDNVAIVVNGNTAPRAISAGQYLFIKNHSSLSTGGYHATTNISNGETITSSKVAADSDGIVNGAFSELNRKIATINSNLAQYGRKTEITVAMPAFNAGQSQQVNTEVTFTDTPFMIQIRDGSGGNPYFVKNWWVSGGFLRMQIQNLAAVSITAANVTAELVF